MSIVKIDDLYLYSSFAKDVVASFQAKKYLEENGLIENRDYVHLIYNNSEDHDMIFSNLGTWDFVDGRHAFSSFPFLIYTEIHDDLKPSQFPKIVRKGVDEIKAGIAELFKLGRS